MAGLETWGEVAAEKGRLERLRSRVVDEDFDWGHEHPLAVHLADSIIYEMHVRGFTRHPCSGVAHPGTFRGVVEKIPYLQELGVTAVELMPVTEFDEGDNPRTNPLTGEPLRNFWGYQPVSFFAPKASYAAGGAPADAVREFKAMVKALHEAGIEVILDIVFNHTGEGDERGATFCWRGLDNPTYYILDPKTGRYLNYSGCGNTLNCNHPVVRILILDALRYWVTEMHVDGFRFDLASILGRGRDGEVLPQPAAARAIAADPVLADVKLIAEAWDAAGLYQVGSFPTWGRWAEWNGKFRDEVRRFVKSDAGHGARSSPRGSRAAPTSTRAGPRPVPLDQLRHLPRRLHAGRPRLLQRQAQRGERRGQPRRARRQPVLELRRRGPSSRPEVNALRRRQQRNFLTLLFFSQGVPMLLAGDEFGRTQRGNNNAYCQDNEISWLDWSLLEHERRPLRLHADLIRFRKAHPALRRRTFFEDEREAARRVARDEAREARLDRRVAGARHAPPGDGGDEPIYLIANAHWEAKSFELPKLLAGTAWRRFLDTSLPPGQDAVLPGAEVAIPPGRYAAGPRSVVVLVGR